MKLMNTPRSVDLSITNRCNLKCKYCFHFTSEGDTGEDLPTEEWLNFFKELKDCAVMDVCLSGGEPFIRKDLEELIKGIVKNRMRFNLLSNGTCITSEIASFISSTKRCNHIQISIDGSIAETHESFRGKGTFKKALEGIKNLQTHRIPVTVRVTIHRHNVGELEEIAKLLLEDIGLPSFSTNSASYMGLCRQYAEEVMLSPEDRILAIEKLLSLTEKYQGRISAQAGPLAEGRNWLEMEKARKEGKENIPGRGFLTSCGGVFSKIAVRADGTIVPCSQMPHIELGRINKDNLKDIWHKHPELKRLRERRKVSLSEFEFCRECKYINYCAGGCPATSYTLHGKEIHPSADSCLKRFLEEGGKIPEWVEKAGEETLCRVC